MTDKNLFDGLDPRLVEHFSGRPEALKDEQFLTSKVNSAHAAATTNVDFCYRTPSQEPLSLQIIFALNLALLAEYLETEFYSRGLNTSGLIPNELRQTFVRILLNEVAQREILLAVLGNRAIPKPAFDYTARGVLPDVFRNFATFAGLGKTFEDNGVRAYKGQAPTVKANKFVLTTALRFHSVEARHAAELRRIVGEKAWITENNRGPVPPLAQPIYNGEENTNQGGIDLVDLTGYSRAAVSEAFDEPLTATRVLRNVAPFIRSGLFF